MKLLAVAGEPSGDQRGSELLRELASLTSSLTVFGMGGSLMASQGMELLFDLSDYSVMGFTEVLGSLVSLRRMEKGLREACLSRKPDAVLLVDYPGFNLRFARWAHDRGLPVIYYVSPQLWAWARWRVTRVHRNVDLMITLFEFERDFYLQNGVNAVWSGHPLAEKACIASVCPEEASIALLPGSRTQEVRRLLPGMLDAFRLLRDRGVVNKAFVARSENADPSLFEFAGSLESVEIHDSTDHVLESCRVALVCSGTATLETAVHGVPLVVCYRTSFPTYAIARLLVRGVNRIGMANIVAGRDVAPELIQGAATGRRMADAAQILSSDGDERTEALEGLKLVREKLGPPGGAVRAAEAVLTQLKRTV
jgi:lipid-A-disaccharide synthase